MGQHLVTHDPCDPSDFRDPFDLWPMTHRPIPCSDIPIEAVFEGITGVQA